MRWSHGIILIKTPLEIEFVLMTFTPSATMPSPPEILLPSTSSFLNICSQMLLKFSADSCWYQASVHGGIASGEHHILLKLLHVTKERQEPASQLRPTRCQQFIQKKEFNIQWYLG